MVPAVLVTRLVPPLPHIAVSRVNASVSKLNRRQTAPAFNVMFSLTSHSVRNCAVLKRLTTLDGRSRISANWKFAGSVTLVPKVNLGDPMLV
jgi:hypothetical protein